jgi:peptidoglycan lytic transglycosylase G
VTGSDQPPRGKERAAARLRGAPSRAANKAEAKARSTTPAAEPPAPAPTPAPKAKSASTGDPSRARTGSGASKSERAAGAARQQRSAAANVDKPTNGAAARPKNGNGGLPVLSLRARAPAEPSPRRLLPPPEAYPSLSERLLNEPDTPPRNAKNSGLIAPRSPRTALEPDTVAMPAKPSKRVRHPFVIVGNAIISIFVLAALVAGVVLVSGKQRFDVPGPLAEDRVVNIPRGSGIREIADVLMREGVIDQPWVFVGGVLVLKAREDLKAGEYQFKAHASLREVVATIVEGRVVSHQFTIPEGLTSEQIVARLGDDDTLTGNIKEIPREGTLLPDTYNFTRGTSREQMIQRMQQAQQRAVKEVWERRYQDLPIKTPEQLVILASLVEKETGKPEERTRVAAVFINRLKQKMRLQSDPTIIYGLVGGKGTLGRPIMKSEIEQPTPYNTYQIDGLPPGPISNPGRASLEAAANPARTRELYFVADGTGGHAFADSYEQHQKNVARLRALEAERREQSTGDPQSTASPQPAAAPPTPTSRRRR